MGVCACIRCCVMCPSISWLQVAFKPVADAAHSVVLTSGTLAPLEGFASEVRRSSGPALAGGTLRHLPPLALSCCPSRRLLPVRLRAVSVCAARLVGACLATCTLPCSLPCCPSTWPCTTCAAGHALWHHPGGAPRGGHAAPGVGRRGGRRARRHAACGEQWMAWRAKELLCWVCTAAPRCRFNRAYMHCCSRAWQATDSSRHGIVSGRLQRSPLLFSGRRQRSPLLHGPEQHHTLLAAPPPPPAPRGVLRRPPTRTSATPPSRTLWGGWCWRRRPPSLTACSSSCPPTRCWTA